jgi:hypothetical protein
MAATVLCRFGVHRWKRVWKDGDSYENCARCGKLRMNYGSIKGLERDSQDFFRSGMAPDHESDD